MAHNIQQIQHEIDTEQRELSNLMRKQNDLKRHFDQGNDRLNDQINHANRDIIELQRKLQHETEVARREAEHSDHH